MDLRSIRDDLKPIETLDIKFFEGGLGDSIARLPAVRYILEQYPHIKSVRLIAQDYFKPLAEFVFKGYPVKYVGYSELKEELKRQPSQAGTFTDVLQHTTLRTHLTHHAFNVIANESPIHPGYYNYIKLNTNLITSEILIIPKQYAVITVGFTAAVREWLPSEINKVAQWFSLKGITPVFLGKSENSFNGSKVTHTNIKNEEIDYSLGINLVDKTSLLEAAKIMSKAKVVVGVDNGLLHLAGMTDVPIVAGYTTVSPYHRMPIRNNTLGWNCRPIVPEVGCGLCQTKANFLYNFDFRNCYYGDYKCLYDMSAKRFIRELEFVCH